MKAETVILAALLVCIVLTLSACTPQEIAEIDTHQKEVLVTYTASFQEPEMINTFTQSEMTEIINPYFSVQNSTDEIFRVDHAGNFYLYPLTTCGKLYTDGAGLLTCGTDLDTNLSDGGTVTGNLSVTGYISGQPIDGSIGSGVIWSDDIDSEANVNITIDGLDITYPNVLVRLVTTAGTTSYCNITSGTETISNNIHYVFYVDSDCIIKNTTFSNYMDTALSPGGQTDIFNALAVDDTIEVYKGITIANKETIKVRKTMLEIAHLNILSGMDLNIDTTFPEIYQNTGEYLYIRTVADTSAQNSTSDGIHQVDHVSGDWVHNSQTGINLSYCDDGTDLVECATNVFRRYIVYTIGRDDGTDTTGLHMLAPLTTDQTHTVLANCLNTVDYPISYILPSFEDNVAVVTYAYCGKRDDASWQEGWIDLRRATGGAGALPDTSNFLTKDTTFGGDVSGVYNAIVVADYSHLLDADNITNLNATIDAREYNTNCSVDNSCVGIVYEVELNKTYVDTQDSAQDECSEITGCVENAYNAEANLTGLLDDNYRAESWDNITGIPTATPSDGDTTHLSTADQIYDYIDGLNYVANAWDADADIDADEISESKINFVTACAAGDYYRLTGNDLECTTPTDTDTNLTEDNVEAYIFDSDNTANLNMSSYNITMGSYTMYSNSTCFVIKVGTTYLEVCE